MSYVRTSELADRKRGHISAALYQDVDFHTLTPGFDRLRLGYQAMPEIDRSQVDTSVTLCGRRLSMPLIISSMTGGTPEAAEINVRLAAAAQRFGIAMGVGSQRVAIERPELARTFQVRDVAPDILLFANLGAVQLNNGLGPDDCLRAVDMIDADAIILHLNPLQECVQINGNTNFGSLADRIGEVCDAFELPVIVKEVGHGISAQTARRLVDAGVDAIDVAGAGGTSWAKVESLAEPDSGKAALGLALGEWGIPTVDSLAAVRNVTPHLTVIASGGVRTGEDIAKCIALGADAAGIALPFLRLAVQSYEALCEGIAQLREELEIVMFCTGCATVEDLRAQSLSPITHNP